MTLLILALLFGIAVMVFVVREFVLDGGIGFSGFELHSKVCKILELLISVEAAAYIVIFLMVVVKTLLI